VSRASFIERFWSRVDFDGPRPTHVALDEPCWIWKGGISTDTGYGYLSTKHHKFAHSHRVVWMLTKGDPGKLFVCHKCDNRLCCNPSHLFLGTCKDNMEDAKRKGRIAIPALAMVNRTKTHCPRGHAYDGVNVYGKRICRICMAINEQSYLARKKAM